MPTGRGWRNPATDARRRRRFGECIRDLRASPTAVFCPVDESSDLRLHRLARQLVGSQRWQLCADLVGPSIRGPVRERSTLVGQPRHERPGADGARRFAGATRRDEGEQVAARVFRPRFRVPRRFQGGSEILPKVHDSEAGRHRRTGAHRDPTPAVAFPPAVLDRIIHTGEGVAQRPDAIERCRYRTERHDVVATGIDHRPMVSGYDLRRHFGRERGQRGADRAVQRRSDGPARGEAFVCMVTAEPFEVGAQLRMQQAAQRRRLPPGEPVPYFVAVHGDDRVV